MSKDVPLARGSRLQVSGVHMEKKDKSRRRTELPFAQFL